MFVHGAFPFFKRDFNSFKGVLKVKENGSLPFSVGKWLDSIQGCLCSSQIFHAIPSSTFSEYKRRAVGEKTVCSGFWIQKQASFSPAMKKMLGFRLSSPLPFVEEPCPLRLQTVFSTQKPSQNKSTDFAGAKVACFPNPLS